MHTLHSVSVAFVLLLAGPGLPGAYGSPDTGSASVSSEEILRSFEPALSEPYRIGPGDEVSLESPGRPEIGGRHVVGPDGTISVPLAGNLNIGDRTREEAGALITSRLSEYYKNSPVQVRIDKYGSNHVVVLGKVNRPGVIQTEAVPTLLDVLTKATGLLAGSVPKLPVRCAIFRGSDAVVWLDVRKLAESGNRLANMRLRRSDVIYVPAEDEQFVSVLGEVGHPGVVNLTEGSTPLSVLATAGGVREGGDTNRIQILRAKTGELVTVRLQDLLSRSGQAEVVLRAGDVMYIPRSGFTKFSSVLQRISPVGSIMMMGAMVTR